MKQKVGGETRDSGGTISLDLFHPTPHSLPYYQEGVRRSGEDEGGREAKVLSSTVTPQMKFDDRPYGTSSGSVSGPPLPSLEDRQFVGVYPRQTAM